MKLLSFSTRSIKTFFVLYFLLYLIILFLSPNRILAQNADSVYYYRDTIQNVKQNADQNYEKLVIRYKTFWDRMVPKYTKIQFAGGMGLVSFGFGWNYGKHNQWETDLFLGYLPKYNTKSAKGTFTLKQNYIPWSIPIGNKFISIEPLKCGLYFNTILSNDYWLEEPERYPKGYYGFSTRIRSYIFIGQSFTCNIRPNKYKRYQSISLYYELSTCDVYVITKFKNKSITFNDIIKLSFGLKFQIL